MARAKDSSKTSGRTGPKRRTRRKPRPVVIDLEATEVTQEKVASEPDDAAGEEAKTKPEESTLTDKHPSTGEVEPGEKTSKPDPDTNDEPAFGAKIPFPVTPQVALHAIPYALSAIIGGILSLLIYFGLAGMGWLPGTAGPETTRMGSEIVVLRQQIEKISSDLEATKVEAIDQIRTRLSALESGTAKVGDVAAVDRRIDVQQALLSRIGETQQTDSDRLTTLTERMGSAETALGLARDLAEGLGQQVASLASAQRGTADSGAVEDLQNRIDKLDKLIQDAATSAGVSSLASAVPIAALRGEMDKIREQAMIARQQLQIKITSLETKILDLQTASRDTATGISELSDRASERLQAMDNALANIEILRDAGPASQMERRAAMALAFANLGRAVESGKAYGVELDAARAFAGDKVEFETLAPYADNGIETIKSLNDRFAAVATAVVSAEREAREGGLLDRAWARLRTIVRVRPTGFVEGDSIAAIIARSEAYLRDGKLDEALREMDTLPEITGQPASDWISAARARRDGDAALAALNAGLIAAIGAARDSSREGTN